MRTPAPATNPWVAAAAAAVLVLLDAFILNQGLLSLLVGFWLVVILLPWTALAPRYKGTRIPRLRNIFIGIGAAALAIGLNVANNSLAKSRADTLITAVRAFHAAEGRYPSALQELVPRYAPEIPLAKYAFLWNTFSYSGGARDATLTYVVLPPFGRKTYRFSDARWGVID